MSIESADAVLALRTELEKNQSGVLEDIAARHGARTRDALDALPESCRTGVPGTDFETVMSDVSGWGGVTFLVNTGDVILECKGDVPPGRFARGYYNLEGGAFGGHLRAGACDAIYFVRRPFMKLDSCSLWFIDRRGEPMFKIFVGRNPDRSLKAEQLARFQALRTRLCVH